MTDWIDKAAEEIAEALQPFLGALINAASIEEIAAIIRRHEPGWMPIDHSDPPKGPQQFYHPPRVTGRIEFPAMYRIGFYPDTPNRRPTHWRPLPTPPED